MSALQHMEPVTDPYAELAADYEWLESDDWHSGEVFLERFADVVSYLPAGARVLDCACGSGSAALALARQGFSVHASDASPAMVARTAERAREAGVDLELDVARWQELPETHPEPFDAVFCTGNSLAHALDEVALVESLRGMRDVLGPGGTLAIDSRDWERLRDERAHVSLPERAIERDGRSCLPIRVWALQAGLGEPQEVELVFVFGEDGELAVRRHRLPFRPFTGAELEHALDALGLVILDWAWDQAGQHYRVVAERPAKP